MQPPSNDPIPPALRETLKVHASAHASESKPHRDDATARVVYAMADTKPGRIEAGLQQLLKPRVHLGGTSVSAYNAFGVLGIGFLVAISLGLTIARGLSIPVMMGLLALALCVSVLNIAVTTLVTGKDRLVFLRYFLSIMAASALFLRISQQPVLPYLENLMPGIGAMQGVGRMGCFRVGCCFGKPSRFGVRYPALYARAGFPGNLVGVRLFPVQLLESAWVLFSAGAGILLVLSGAQAGYGLSTYILLFACGRFCFELLRGDELRTHLGGLSEAQWISICLAGGIVVLEQTAVLPYHVWHQVTGAGLFAGLIVLLYKIKFSPGFQLREPETIHKLAKTLSLLEQGRAQQLSGSHAVHLRKVGFELNISDGIFMEGGAHKIHHYTLSYATREMPARDAIVIAKMIQSWHPREEKTKLINNNTHSFHLLRYHSLTDV